MVIFCEQCWQRKWCSRVLGSALSQDRIFTALAAAVLLSILSLGGCVTSTSMDARAEVPPKPTAYLPVEDVPTAARDRQASKGKAKGTSHAEPVKP
jgi:hypothetical protein